MSLTADRCKETSTTTGTGNFTLAGAVTQFKSFSSSIPTGITFMYAIVGQSGTEWEVGNGTLVSPTSLSRGDVKSSSNSDNLVNFSAGTKDVFATITASKIAEIPRSVTAQIDFGTTSNGSTSIFVSASWVTNTSKILITPSGATTIEHSPEDYILEGVYGIPSSIINGVGFTLLAGCKNETFGKYVFNIIGV